MLSIKILGLLRPFFAISSPASSEELTRSRTLSIQTDLSLLAVFVSLAPNQCPGNVSQKSCFSH